MVGVAVKFTVVPEHTVVSSATIVTEGTADETTFMVSAFEVTVAGVGQAALEVNSQVITSLLARVEVV